jgi:hypothetical protein
MYPTFVYRISSTRLSIHQFEEIVENEKAPSTIRHQLEGLAVIHGVWFVIDLGDLMSAAICKSHTFGTYQERTGD